MVHFPRFNIIIISMQKTIFVFGNPDLPDDALAVQLVPDLEKLFPSLAFRIVDPNELDLLEQKEVIALDTVQGLKNPRWIKIEELAETGRQVTAHDFDASTYLLLFKKIYPNIVIRILGIPYGGEKKFILENIQALLEKI